MKTDSKIKLLSISLFLELTIVSTAFHFDRCGRPTCVCFREARRVNCNRLSSPHRQVPLFNRHEVENMTTLDLSNNDIRELKFEDFDPYIWRNLKVVDLSQNRDLNCATLMRAPPGVKITSDCSAALLRQGNPIYNVEEGVYQREMHEVDEPSDDTYKPNIGVSEDDEGETESIRDQTFGTLLDRLRLLTRSKPGSSGLPPRSYPSLQNVEDEDEKDRYDVTDSFRGDGPYEEQSRFAEQVVAVNAPQHDSPDDDVTENADVIRGSVLRIPARDALLEDEANHFSGGRGFGRPTKLSPANIAIQTNSVDDGNDYRLDFGSVDIKGGRPKLYIKASGVVDGKPVKTFADGRWKMALNFKGVIKIASG